MLFFYIRMILLQDYSRILRLLIENENPIQQWPLTDGVRCYFIKKRDNSAFSLARLRWCVHHFPGFYFPAKYFINEIEKLGENSSSAVGKPGGVAEWFP